MLVGGFRAHRPRHGRRRDLRTYRLSRPRGALRRRLVCAVFPAACGNALLDRHGNAAEKVRVPFGSAHAGPPRARGSAARFLRRYSRARAQRNASRNARPPRAGGSRGIRAGGAARPSRARRRRSRAARFLSATDGAARARIGRAFRGRAVPPQPRDPVFERSREQLSQQPHLRPRFAVQYLSAPFERDARLFAGVGIVGIGQADRRARALFGGLRRPHRGRASVHAPPRDGGASRARADGERPQLSAVAFLPCARAACGGGARLLRQRRSLYGDVQFRTKYRRLRRSRRACAPRVRRACPLDI